MPNTIKLRKGLNIRMKGKADPVLDKASLPGMVALMPADFQGMTPRLDVEPGQEIRAGEPLFHDKYNPEILFVAPVGGTVATVNRGERRRILEVIINADYSKEAVDFGKADPLTMDADQIRELLLKAGMWPFLKRRPYGILAKPGETPKAIFISCFDTSPLAPDLNFILKGQEKVFQTGINALSKLTSGKVHLGLPAGVDHVCRNMGNAEITFWDGPHPAGNVGIQIHHTDPVMKGDVVWTISAPDVLIIGRLFETGRPDFTKTIALAGSEVSKPCYYQTIPGAAISSVTHGKLTSGNDKRVISGNVLTGKKVPTDGFLGFYDSLVSVIPEGKYYEFLGWAMPRTDMFSMSRTYFSWLNPRKTFAPDANLHGEKRAYVMTGQYEKVLPMDLLPVLLIKSILAEDIDKMEMLGIYEVIEEDLALCEFVCTSKIEVQNILRKGINLMMKELG